MYRLSISALFLLFVLSAACGEDKSDEAPMKSQNAATDEGTQQSPVKSADTTDNGIPATFVFSGLGLSVTGPDCLKLSANTDTEGSLQPSTPSCRSLPIGGLRLRDASQSYKRLATSVDYVTNTLKGTITETSGSDGDYVLRWTRHKEITKSDQFGIIKTRPLGTTTILCESDDLNEQQLNLAMSMCDGLKVAE